MAHERRMSLEKFGAYCEVHPEMDRELDQRQVDFLRKGPLLLEGRLSGYLADREEIPSFKVWFTCDPYVRSDRIVEREGGDRESRLEEMRRREASEKKRYLEFYGFDLGDLGVYDLVLDTTSLGPAQVVDAVVLGYDRWSRPAPRWMFWKR